jgi:hypothetical protein
MLIRNLILGHLTLSDDGETVLIQDYGLTAYAGMWCPHQSTGAFPFGSK